MTEVLQAPGAYADDFEAVPGGPLDELRRAAFGRFSDLGFPTLRDEDWRFTNLAPITATPFRLAGRAALPAGVVAARHGWPRLTFVNGHCHDDGALRRGHAVSIAARLAAGDPVLAAHLGRHASCDDAFTALNTAFLADGAVVHVPRETVLDDPIELLFVTAPGPTAAVAHPRVLVVAETGSQVTVVERHLGAGDAEAFTNSVCEIVAADNSVVDHYHLVDAPDHASHVGMTWIEMGRGSNVTSHSITLGGRLVRNNVTAILGGEGGDCHLNGLYLVSGQSHVDNFLRVEHAAPHCDSREYYKGILDDRGRAAFTGRIVVHLDAQKTDAKQTNKNLLLSSGAQVDTRPQLEIMADDVKCTHGATIGQIDPDQVFYLRARGIEEQAARSLLLYAFAAESLEAVRPGLLRRELTGRLLDLLPGGAMLGSLL